MNYRRPHADDFEKIVALHNKNLKSALTPAEQANGFLSASFTAEQFQAMDQDLCVIACVDDDGNLLGYLCASTPAFNRQFPLLSAMIDCYPGIDYRGKPISEYRSFITGPVCIEKAFRGQGIYQNLFKTLFDAVPSEYELALTCISTENPRSLASAKKIGREVVGEFEFGGKKFWIVAKALQEKI